MRLELQDAVELQILPVAISLVGEGGYAALANTTLPGSADDVFRGAYDAISADLMDELEDCAASASCNEERIRTSVGALVDFAAVGGPKADLWLVAVHDARDETRQRRRLVLDRMARLVVSGIRPTVDARESECEIRDLFVLGGVLDRLSTLRRAGDTAAIRSAEPYLVAFAIALFSAQWRERTM